MCKKKVIAKGGNTSNLLSHVKIYHPLEHVKLKKSVDASKRCGKDGESSKAQNSLSAMLKSAQNALHSIHPFLDRPSWFFKIKVWLFEL